MKLDVYNLDRQKVGELDLAEEVFGAEVKPWLHQEVVRYQMAKRRRGTHAVKTRHFVAGTTKKMYRQKGTGNARHGSAKAHIFVGGGVVHGPTQRSYAYTVPRKVRRGALRSALSQKVADGKLTVVKDISFEQPKTKNFLSVMSTFEMDRVLVLDLDNANLSLSVRNLPKSKFLKAEGLNVYDILHYDNILATEAAIRHVEGALKG